MPDAVVCQCGADALSQDPLGGGNLTLEAYTTCVTHVANLSKPTLFLGGGVYLSSYLLFCSLKDLSNACVDLSPYLLVSNLLF